MTQVGNEQTVLEDCTGALLAGGSGKTAKQAYLSKGADKLCMECLAETGEHLVHVTVLP